MNNNIKSTNLTTVLGAFFIVVLFCVGIYVLFDRSIEDVVYLGVLIYYFGRFLVIKHRR